jgi:hypothetical protein
VTVLKTRIAFIDTSIFVQSNFSYDAPTFASLVDLRGQGRVEIKLTDITVQEVKANIRESVQDAEQASRRFQVKARILRNLHADPRFAPLFAPLPVDEVCATLESQFDSLVLNLQAEVLAASTRSGRQVFEKYFRGEAPFGFGKKKHEFPDAFVLEALKAFCEQSGAEIYVISEDRDLRDACETSATLHHLDSLAEFVSLVLETDTRTQRVVNAVSSAPEAIRSAIEEQFVENGALLEDQPEGDVIDVTVSDVDFDLRKVSVVRVSAEEAVVAIPVEISYRAEFSYPDPGATYYDSEDQRTYCFNTIHGESDGVHKCIAELTLELEWDEDESELEFGVAQVSLDGNERLSVYADEDERTFFK